MLWVVAFTRVLYAERWHCISCLESFILQTLFFTSLRMRYFVTSRESLDNLGTFSALWIWKCCFWNLGALFVLMVPDVLAMKLKETSEESRTCALCCWQWKKQTVTNWENVKLHIFALTCKLVLFPFIDSLCYRISGAKGLSHTHFDACAVLNYFFCM